MWQRCTNPKGLRYADYGGRGITVCEQWKDFNNFLIDMGVRPEGKSLDRKDNDKGYSKENCKWATPREQQRNRRNSNFITLNDKKLSIYEVAKKLKSNTKTIEKRILSGWTAERILNTPIETKFRNRKAKHGITK